MNINEAHWNFSDNGTKEPAKSRFWNFYNFWTAWKFLMRFSLLCSGEWALSFYICVFIYIGVSLKGNITFVYAHTANAAWFFPAIIVVTSHVTQKCQRRISRLFVSGVLCFKYALRKVCYMRILIYYEISKRRWEKCIINRAEWTSSSVLHCNVTVAAWRRENTRDVGAAL